MDVDQLIRNGTERRLLKDEVEWLRDKSRKTQPWLNHERWQVISDNA